mgnify:FL=1
MKATGIVRKIDDLGRIVIPKEIRKTLHIHEGDPLEIFIEAKGEVILKKYAPMNEFIDLANDYTDTLNQITGYAVYITDRETIISASGANKDKYLGKGVSDEIIEIMKERKNITISSANTSLCIDEKKEKYSSLIICPIISDAEILGSVILVSKDEKINPSYTTIAEVISKILAKQVE